MEFHGFVRNDEIFNVVQDDYSEWIPAQLKERMGRVVGPFSGIPLSHWFMVRCTHPNGAPINFTAGKFYLRKSKRSYVSKARLLLMLEACCFGGHDDDAED